MAHHPMGRVVEEADLASGDTIQWAGAVVVFGRVEPQVIEELEYKAHTAAGAPAPGC